MPRLALLLLRRRLLPAVFALLSLAAGSAHALCTLTCSCAVSTTNVLFGTINPLSASPTYSNGGVTVTCGGIAGLLIPMQVDISAGGGGSFSSRAMGSGPYRLAYNLYTTNGYATIFGDGTNGTGDASSSILLAALGTAPPVTVPIYGRVPGGQTTLAPGTYADTIAVTLTYY